MIVAADVLWPRERASGLRVGAAGCRGRTAPAVCPRKWSNRLLDDVSSRLAGSAFARLGRLALGSSAGSPEPVAGRADRLVGVVHPAARCVRDQRGGQLLVR